MSGHIQTSVWYLACADCQTTSGNGTVNLAKTISEASLKCLGQHLSPCPGCVSFTNIDVVYQATVKAY